MKSKGRKSLTSPAIRLFKPTGSNKVMGPIALRPARRELQKASNPIPLGATTPMPVMTTRLRFGIQMDRIRGGSRHSSDYAKSSHYIFMAACLHVIHQIFHLFTSWFLFSPEKVSHFRDAILRRGVANYTPFARYGLSFLPPPCLLPPISLKSWSSMTKWGRA